MSHFKERKEKNCLNCNAQVAGRFCQVCGQENIGVKETTWHLIAHFFKDITHFDGKFFSTLRYLIRKPGFVSLEYITGRRASYLSPVRMYIFTSAIFFLIFFSVFKINEDNVKTTSKIKDKTLDEIALMDSAGFSKYTAFENKGKPMSREMFKKYADSIKSIGGIRFTNRNYKTMGEYDSVLASGEKDHNFLQQTLIRRQIQLNKKYKGDQSKILQAFGTTLVHSFPQMLFISLPLFALALTMLYFRRKEYYYTNHLIFSVHLYIFVFIVLLVIIGLSQLKTIVHMGVINWIIGILYASLFYYEYKAMRNFYNQRRGKTILKFILLNIMHLMIIMILFTIFTFFSLLNI